MAAVNNQEMDYAIKPEAVTPTVSTEDWPLLLKNYEKCASFELFFPLSPGVMLTSNFFLPAQCSFAPVTSPRSLLVLRLLSVT